MLLAILGLLNKRPLLYMLGRMQSSARLHSVTIQYNHLHQYILTYELTGDLCLDFY
jgi:hypothetical protein